jgi:hypothetical protein
MPVIEISVEPRNKDHFRKLMAFAQDVLAVCDDIQLSPFLDGSLAVFAYTQCSELEVHDLDLNCSESCFPRLLASLEARGFNAKVTDWHVLQVRRDGLKVEFGAIEHWLQGISESRESLAITGLRFDMVTFDDLRELYRRGLVETANVEDVLVQRKHRAIQEKLRALDALSADSRSP